MLTLEIKIKQIGNITTKCEVIHKCMHISDRIDNILVQTDETKISMLSL